MRPSEGLPTDLAQDSTPRESLDKSFSAADVALTILRRVSLASIVMEINPRYSSAESDLCTVAGEATWDFMMIS